MKFITRLWIVSALVFGVTAPSWALFGLVPTLEGTVKSVDAKSITIASKADKGGDVSLSVDSQTKLESLTAVTELKEGDQVKIAYKEEGGQKIATSITKEGAPAPSMTSPGVPNPEAGKPSTTY